MIPGAKGQKFDASLLAGARSAKQSGIRGEQDTLYERQAV
jgi:hypothetical protein